MKIGILGIAVADVMINKLKKYPKTGTLSLVDSIEMHSGGCAVNVAINLSKLGVETRLATPIGNDIFGLFLKNELSRHHIDLSHLITSETYPTSTSIVLINEQGERSFIHQTGINAKYRSSDIKEEFLDDLDLLLVTGVFLMDDFDEHDLANYLKLAKQKGIYTIVDTAWDDKGLWYQTIKAALPYIDLFIPSYDEAAHITNEKALESIGKWLKEKGSKDIVVKLGKAGAFSLIDNTSKHTKAFLVDKPVDTTGAGDAFVSGVIAGITLSKSIEESIKFGNALGAFVVQAMGASNNVPNMETLIEKVKEYKDEDQ